MGDLGEEISFSLIQNKVILDLLLCLSVNCESGSGSFYPLKLVVKKDKGQRYLM